MTKRILRAGLAFSLILQDLILAGFGVFVFANLMFSSIELRAASRVLNFQGRLTNTSNNPQTGSYDFKFSLYNAPTGGTQLWPSGGLTEDQTLPVTNGIFSAEVGSVTPIPLSAFQVADGTDVYLEIQVQGETMSPRQKMLTVPFAMTLMGRTTAHFVSTGAVTQSIAGDKTFTGDASFSGTITVPAPGASGHAVNRAYVDGLTGGGSSAAVLVGTQTFSGRNTFLNLVTVSTSVHMTGDFKIGSSLIRQQTVGAVGDVTFLKADGSAAPVYAASLYVSSSYSGSPPANGAYILGNVGIGSTSPAEKLDVNGSVRLPLFRISSDNGAATDRPYFRGSAVANSQHVVLTAGGTSDTGLKTLYMGYPEGSGTFSTRIQETLFVSSNSRVGIGTTNPATSLQIQNATPDLHFYIGSVAPSMWLGNSATRSSADAIGLYALSTSNGHYGLNAGSTLLANYGNSRGNMYINSNYSGSGTTHVILQPSSGNVGIGSSAPTQKLDVTGTGNFSTGVAVGGTTLLTNGTYTNLRANANGYIQFMTQASAHLAYLGSDGELRTGGLIYPGRVDVARPSDQQAWYLGSHASYGLYTNTGFFIAGNVLSGGGFYPGNQASYFLSYAGSGWIYTNGHFYASGFIAPENQTSYYLRNASTALGAGGGIYTNGSYYAAGQFYPANQYDYYFAYAGGAWTYTNGNFYSGGHIAPSNQNSYFIYYNGGGQLRTNGGFIVDGAMSKGSGSFDIAHPDPAKKAKGYRLRHYFVESPTAGDNLYRWNVTVKNGAAEIQLPDYFQFLNENVDVWVSPKDHYGRAYGNISADLTKIAIHADRDGDYRVLAVGTRKDDIAAKDFKEHGIEYIRKEK